MNAVNTANGWAQASGCFYTFSLTPIGKQESSAKNKRRLLRKPVTRFARFNVISKGCLKLNTLLSWIRGISRKSASRNGSSFITQIQQMMPALLQKPIKAKLKKKPIKSFINKIIWGDALKTLKRFSDESVDCVVTSPPYWALRDYGVKGQIGLESSVEEYLEKLLAVFDEIKRVLKPSGTAWINFGDTYANSTKGGQRNKPQGNMYDSLTRRATMPKLKTDLNIRAKSLCLIPERFAVGMIEQGWVLRNEIIWHKPNAMPQSVKDRFTVDFEKIFFFVKERKYYFRQQFEPLKNPQELLRRYSNPFEKHIYRKLNGRSYKNLESIKRSQMEILKKGRKKRCVWSIGTGISNGSHFAVYPPRLVETPIKAGCPEGGIVLDPFIGSGTTALVAKKLGREYIGIDLNPEYVRIAKDRIKNLN
jgi:DNA modification methylase